jgi:Ca2+-transporting ATPase
MTTPTNRVDLEGLTSESAARRLVEDGPNELPSAKPRNLLQQSWAVIKQPMLLLLLAAGTVNLILAEPQDSLILMAMVLIVIFISISQERKSETALAKLRDLTSPLALVIRDSKELKIASREVVVGDLIVLAEGDRVPADSMLVSSTNLLVDESMLTGESLAVQKLQDSTLDPTRVSHQVGRPGGESSPWLFSGTLVLKGRGVAEVLATGAKTELGKIGSALKDIDVEKTPLQREIDRLVKIVATIGILAAITVTVAFGATRGTWLEGVLAGIATAMAMLPEEFPVVLTVFMALGAWRLSKYNVLTRRAPVIETLGSATVICVDKTGTLTMNSMVVKELMVNGETHFLGEGELSASCAKLVDYAVLASEVSAVDPMDKAFKVIGAQYLKNLAATLKNLELVREYGLSDQLMAVTHVWRESGSNQFLIAAKGAPEAIAKLCHLDDTQIANLMGFVELATASGQRVLAVASASLQEITSAADLPNDPHAFRFEFLGLAGLYDPVRPGVSASIAECAGAGVRTVMITGDYPGTAMAIAREIGLECSGGVITGPELSSMSEDELAARIGHVNVFARMVPEQKLQLIRALKKNGEVVAMTGDGVNDAPALRAADIGMAMGARGTDVAREAASLVITDDNFTSIANAVRLGRGIFENLRKAMSYIIAVHIPIFGITLIPVFVGEWPLILLPVLIAFLELIIDPACSIVFEAEQVDPEVMKRKPRGLGEPIFSGRVLKIALAQGAVSLLAVLGVLVWATSSAMADDEVRSITFATLVLGNLALILVNRSWSLSMWQSLLHRKNATIKWLLGGSGLALIMMISIAPLATAFSLAPLTLADWAIAAGAATLGVSWFEIYKRTQKDPGN